jgi:hypothetical protein
MACIIVVKYPTFDMAEILLPDPWLAEFHDFALSSASLHLGTNKW